MADADNLHFGYDRFDALIAESVNIFIPECRQAMRLYFQIVKPDDYFSVNKEI